MINSKNINYNYVFLFYDVKEKRVNKVFKKCKKYLNHWQKSVFRGSITPSNIIELESELKKIIDPEEDFISIVKIMNFKTIGETNLGNISKNTEDIFL
ncbi:MAG: CRISPR-associated endonuclease Cas2 [Clostridia bacterium]|nr:CRISPR-associated endonuclease Cas2 [Clostridia bacterium]